MRLIDADKISPRWELTATATDTGVHKTYVYWYRTIDEAPTVEAIPIEWIEEYINKLPKTLEYGFCFESAEAVALKNVLNEWRKENE